MKRFPFVASTLVLGVAAVGLMVPSLRAVAGPKIHKSAICHGTASKKNPYVMIIVDESAKAGHFDGTAPGHGPRNAPDYLLKDNLTADEIAYYRSLGNSACGVPSEGNS